MIWEYLARVDRVVDGDTVWLDVDLGFRHRALIDFRLYAINAPETVGATRPAGLAAKAELERLLRLGPLRIVTFKADRTDKYGRWLATLFVETATGSLDVNAQLVRDGFAVAYMADP